MPCKQITKVFCPTDDHNQMVLDAGLNGFMEEHKEQSGEALRVVNVYQFVRLYPGDGEFMTHVLVVFDVVEKGGDDGAERAGCVDRKRFY